MSAPDGDVICVEVCYAEPQRAVVKAYRLTPPATVRDALQRALSDPDFDGIDIEHAAVGVFGRIAAAEQALNDGDRVEIYRPLAADPKNARRERVRQARKRR